MNKWYQAGLLLSPYARKIRHVTLLAIVVILLWGFAAPWFAAQDLIGSITEYSSYFLSFFAVGFLAFIYACFAPQEGAIRKIWVVSGTFVALALVVTSCGRSNESFFRWKLKATPQSSWERMSLNLKNLGLEAVQNDAAAKVTNGVIQSGSATDIFINRKRIEKDFRDLGPASDYYYGNLVNGTNACVVFGSSFRKWGLVTGPDYLFFSSRPWKRVKVADNCWFFVGWGGCLLIRK